EAGLLGVRLRGYRFDRLVRGDSLRCAETAELALPGGTLKADPRLRELAFGRSEGLTYDECHAVDPESLRAWILDPTRAAPPGGEDVAAFAERVAAALDGLRLEGSALVITHGGPIRRILARSLGLEWRQVVLFQLSPAGITRLALHPEGGHLRCLNDTAHLEADGKTNAEPRP